MTPISDAGAVRRSTVRGATLTRITGLFLPPSAPPEDGVARPARRRSRTDGVALHARDETLPFAKAPPSRPIECSSDLRVPIGTRTPISTSSDTSRSETSSRPCLARPNAARLGRLAPSGAVQVFVNFSLVFQYVSSLVRTIQNSMMSHITKANDAAPPRRGAGRACDLGERRTAIAAPWADPRGRSRRRTRRRRSRAETVAVRRESRHDRGAAVVEDGAASTDATAARFGDGVRGDVSWYLKRR